MIKKEGGLVVQTTTKAEWVQRSKEYYDYEIAMELPKLQDGSENAIVARFSQDVAAGKYWVTIAHEVEGNHTDFVGVPINHFTFAKFMPTE
jgi:hypothetical protein